MLSIKLVNISMFHAHEVRYSSAIVLLFNIDHVNESVFLILEVHHATASKIGQLCCM
jgi:hypothetical protein